MERIAEAHQYVDKGQKKENLFYKLKAIHNNYLFRVSFGTQKNML